MSVAKKVLKRLVENKNGFMEQSEIGGRSRSENQSSLPLISFANNSGVCLAGLASAANDSEWRVAA